jgi:tetratricopeptide (TPR) repeat protein
VLDWWRTRRAVRDPGAALRSGMLRQAEGDLAGAEKDYRAVVAAGAGQQVATAALLLGEVLEDRGDPAGAATAYRQATRTTERGLRAQAWLNLGVLLQQGGDTAGAEDALQRAARSGDKATAKTARERLRVLRAGVPPGVAVLRLEDRALGEELVADRGKLEAFLTEMDAEHLVGQSYEGKRTEAGYEIWFRRR